MPNINLFFRNIIFTLFISLFSFIISFSAYSQNDDSNETTGDWRVFRGNPARTGHTSLTGPPEEMEMKWRWKMSYESSSVSASPVIDDTGRVCVGTQGGRFAVIDNSGGQGWTYDVKDPVKTSAAVNTDGSIFVITEKGYMYYLNHNGELQWKCDYNQRVHSSPLIAGNNAVFAINNNEILAVNLEPEITYPRESKTLYLDEVKQWSVSLEDSVKVSPAYSDDMFFIAAGRWLYALEINGGEDNSTSQVKWRFGATSDIQSTPAVSDGTVFVGDSSGYLYALDAASNEYEGSEIWKRKLSGGVSSSVAVHEDDGKKMLYVGTDSGSLYAYTQDGGYEWIFPATGAIRSSPSVDGNGDVYFGSDDGYVYALFHDGSLKWKYRTYGKVVSSPAIGADNRLYIGSDDGYLYCFGESTREETKPDISITTASNIYELEYDGNPVTIAPKIDSETEGNNILGRIASVTIDLTSLELFGITQKDRENPFSVPDYITTDLMLDDGMYEDDVAGDGIFTYAFAITSSPELIGFDRTTGAFNHYLPPEMLAVGPVTAMITVTDLFGNRVSKPIVFNFIEKFRGIPRAEFNLDNRLNRQTLIMSFSSGTPSILSVAPATGRPGTRQNITIIGLNTNFTKRRTRIEIFNKEGFRIARALPGEDDVNVLSDTMLDAVLNILATDEVTDGELIGRWDVTVTTTFPDGAEEVVIGERLFEISSTTQRVGQDFTHDFISINPDVNNSFFEDSYCEFTFDLTNAYGGRPRNAPWQITSGYPREIIILDAQSGQWNLSVDIDDGCVVPPTFKILIKGTNFGYLTGQVRDGVTGNGVDGVLITALTGEGGSAEGNTTTSSGDGYYMLPLSAALSNYTVKAEKDGKVDIKRRVSITADEETDINFSLFQGAACPLLEVLSPNASMDFRSFRDNVLSFDVRGREWVRLYYKHSDEVRTIISNSVDVRNKFLLCIIYSFTAMSQYFTAEGINPYFSNVVDEFIESLKKNAGGELYRDLSYEHENIISFLKLMEQ